MNRPMAALCAVAVLSSFAVADCPKNTVEVSPGSCAALPSPSEQALAPAIGVVSDEKAQRHPEPAYLRGEVHADEPQSLIYKDIQQDSNIAQANSEGKKAAGLK